MRGMGFAIGVNECKMIEPADTVRAIMLVIRERGVLFDKSVQHSRSMNVKEIKNVMEQRRWVTRGREGELFTE